MTNVFISVDMEGIAGIAHLQQVWRGSDDFPAARELMIGEANAAVAGAFEGGATTAVVNDSHGDMYNLLPEKLDARAELILGSPKTLSMMQGFGPDFDVALFVGYHAAAGTQAAVLDHTYSGRLIYEIRLNGEPATEAELNAAFAGTYGVPVGLVTGDDKACAQAAKRLPGIRTVVVKEGYGRNVAKSIHPSAAREAIRKAAAETVAARGELQPYRADPPFVLEADVANTSAADLCALAPGTDRTGPRTVRFQSEDFREAFRCLLAWTYLGSSEAPRYAGT
ncbi:MAG TPA: M55 family metallopeptidase [Actinomycetota bacterium]